MGLTLGYHEVFGERKSWDDLAMRLGRYHRAAVFNLLGRISFLLDRASAAGMREVQEKLIEAVFGANGAVVWNRFASESGRDDSPVALFHEAQLLAVAKATYLIDETEATVAETTSELGEALLIMTDLLDSEYRALTDEGYETLEGNRRWQLYVLANTHFNSDENLVHALARSYDLYLMDKAHLRSHEAYLNLPDRLERATGLPADTMWMGLIAIVARWLSYGPEDFLGNDMRIPVSSYFSAGFRVNADENERFFRLVAETDQRTGILVREKYARDNLQAFNPMPFARAPIVLFGDWGLPVSAPLLRERLTNGIRHTFLEPEKFTHTERNQFLRFMGIVFEDYVHRSFERALGDSPARYINGKTVRESVTGKACDGAVVYGDAVVLFETKATSLPLGASSGQEWHSYQRVTRDVLVHGAEQLHSTIQSIERGELKHLGLDPVAIRRYAPLVISLERIAQHRLLTEAVENEIRDRGVVRNESTLPLQIMSVGELEIAEKAVARGRSLLDLVSDKAMNGADALSFRNWWFEKEETFLEGHNSFLSDLYFKAGARATTVLKERSRVSPDPVAQVEDPPESESNRLQ